MKNHDQALLPSFGSVMLIFRCAVIAVVLVLTGIVFCFAQCAKFEPPAGKALLIMGQDLDATGGMPPSYTNGYIDHLNDVPAGITTYLNLSTLDGLNTSTNYGAGDLCAQCISTTFTNSTIAIGLYLWQGDMNGIENGSFDHKIVELANWIKTQNKPVFLRIGYEFDYNYSQSQYIKVYQRIVDKTRAAGVTNCAFVWQDTGQKTAKELLKWYPGDDYVDWMAFSFFWVKNPVAKGIIGEGCLELARSHKKPVMIAEATPYGYHTATDNGTTLWNEWFGPFFDYIHTNNDVVKAVAYINQNWDAQPMWVNQGFGDSRVQVNSTIKTKWINETTSNFWIHSSPTLFKTLNSKCDSIVTSIQINSFKEAPEVYPNPFNENITVRLDNLNNEAVKISIQTLEGTEVFNETNYYSQPVEIAKDFNQGIYIMTITTANHLFVKKLIKL